MRDGVSHRRKHVAEIAQSTHAPLQREWRGEGTGDGAPNWSHRLDKRKWNNGEQWRHRRSLGVVSARCRAFLFARRHRLRQERFENTGATLKPEVTATNLSSQYTRDHSGGSDEWYHLSCRPCRCGVGSPVAVRTALSPGRTPIAAAGHAGAVVRGLVTLWGLLSLVLARRLRRSSGSEFLSVGIGIRSVYF